MRRREFIALLGGAAVTTPLSCPPAARAQQAGTRRIAWLENSPADSPRARARLSAVKDELGKLGWAAGRNLTIDYRSGVTSVEMAQQFGAELLSLSPDVVFCVGSPGVKALQQATKTVPIVFIQVAEPVDQGFVQSLSRPGGNITGFAYLERTIGAKWLALLTEIAPSVKQVAYVFSPKAAPYAHFYYESAQAAAAAKTGIQTSINPVNEAADFEPILSHLGANGGVILNADAFIGSSAKLTIDLTTKYRLPAIYGGGGSDSWIRDGGLISYSPEELAQFRQAALYLDRILKGEKPADLPVQQPEKFQYVINLKTAKALGLAVPLSMQMTADEVIE
jgi:putative tryptophan/tyrosine transport system substrate-binding protein